MSSNIKGSSLSIDKSGAFVKPASVFREFIKKNSRFTPEADRYILYVSLACPWAHRTLLVRALKGLESIIRVVIVHYLLDLNGVGWKFDKSPAPFRHCSRDPVMDADCLRDLYFKANPKYQGRASTPVLWDTVYSTIVSNESADIMQMLNEEFKEFAKNKNVELRPKELHAAIERENEWIYEDLNHGVYKAGFATSQSQYETNARNVVKALIKLENQFKHFKFYQGDQLTDTDIRIFTTILRFDPVYFGLFKCNVLAVNDCPNIKRWMTDLLTIPEVKSTVDMEHIKRHYYESLKHINPSGIVPLSNGPADISHFYSS